MPANLTAQYMQAEARFKEATSPAEKLSALEEMLRAIPKHKGTEKMQADIKRRLSKLRKESQKKKNTSSQRPFHSVEREGAGQVILSGPPNSGKSQLLARLTRAQPEVADYAFTTRFPQPGMMAYQDIQIQLVDTPALAPEALEPWQLALIRQGDVVLLVFDVNESQLLEQTDFILSTFHERAIRLEGSRPPVLILGNKTDQPEGKANFAAWQELYRNRFTAQPFSSLSEPDLDSIRSQLFHRLEVVRVYTKAPGKKRDEKASPYVLKRGSTILDVATTVHQEVGLKFRYARVWGSTKFGGQKVEKNYIMEDGDVAEIHI